MKPLELLNLYEASDILMMSLLDLVTTKVPGSMVEKVTFIRRDQEMICKTKIGKGYKRSQRYKLQKDPVRRITPE